MQVTLILGSWHRRCLSPSSSKNGSGKAEWVAPSPSVSERRVVQMDLHYKYNYSMSCLSDIIACKATFETYYRIFPFPVKNPVGPHRNLPPPPLFCFSILGVLGGDRSITRAISKIFQGDHSDDSAAGGRDSLRSFTTFPPVQTQTIVRSRVEESSRIKFSFFCLPRDVITWDDILHLINRVWYMIVNREIFKLNYFHLLSNNCHVLCCALFCNP